MSSGKVVLSTEKNASMRLNFKLHTFSLVRDKIICSRYFTTLSVRLFLETQERKRDLGIFANGFAAINMLDEKVKRIVKLVCLFSANIKTLIWSFRYWYVHKLLFL